MIEFDSAEDILKALGLSRFEDLILELPKSVRDRIEKTPQNFDFPVGRRLKEMKRVVQDEDIPVFFGAGRYDRDIPMAVEKMANKTDYYSSSKARSPMAAIDILRALILYRDSICQLTGMAAAAPSLYCGATALVTACQIAVETTRRKIVLAPNSLDPDQLNLLEAYSCDGAFELRIIKEKNGLVDLDALNVVLFEEGKNVATVLVQYPNFYGLLEPVPQIIANAKKMGALSIVATDPVSLAVLKSPGEWGADIVVGDVTPNGTANVYDSIHQGFIAVSAKILERLPERLLEKADDGLMDKQTRYKPVLAVHRLIERETMNSNSLPKKIERPKDAFDATVALMYYAFLDSNAFLEAAGKSYRIAKYAREEFKKAGFDFMHSSPYLHEFAVKINDPEGLNRYLRKWGIIGGYELKDAVLLAFTEKRTPEEVDELIYFMKLFQDGVEI